MDDETALDRLRDNLTGIVSLLVTGVWMTGLFTGQEWWLPALIVGYAVVLPLVGILAGEDTDADDWVDLGDSQSADTSERRRTEHDEADGGSTKDALETLRERYARGELTEQQFERKLDRLLETESVEDAEAYRRRARRDVDGPEPRETTDAADRGDERERERE
ncbi:SHOCT domain-containing protein [Halobaculum sp. MBLA0147]|uniref:SHOCT domain-containing protein n=1 Tax=Halobaculum sp. MBLA0147 TaxID=3079934 RepID=UPI0035250AF2